MNMAICSYDFHGLNKRFISFLLGVLVCLNFVSYFSEVLCVNLNVSFVKFDILFLFAVASLVNVIVIDRKKIVIK